MSRNEYVKPLQLLSGENIVLHLRDLQIFADEGRDGYVTNKRIVFIGKGKTHEMMNNDITYMKLERLTDKWLLKWSPIFVIFLFLIILRDLMMTILSYLIFIAMYFFWLRRITFLRIEGVGKKITITGLEDVSRKLMTEIRNQL